MIKDVKIPEISENVESGTVVSILVKVGDMVEADDPVIEFETEKAVVEIPCPVAGKIAEILVEEGEEKNVGDVIAKVDTEGGAEETEQPPEEEPPEEEATAKTEEKEKEAETPEAETPARKKASSEPEGGPDREEEDKAEPAGKEAEKPEEKTAQKEVPAGPAVRRLARELGVDLGDVEGTGPGGRITDADVKSHVREGGAKRKRTQKEAEPAQAYREPPLPDFTRWGEVETEDLDTVRRLTAEGTSVSWRAIPHVTQFDEADITELQVFLEKNAGKIEKAGGKLTVTAVVMKVCAEALKRFPRFNASIDLAEKKLVYKKYIHIGVMVDTPRGLLVPVVRDADAKRIGDLAVEIVDLADRARNKKIKPDEMEGGTFSISNQGGIGGSGFTPVILWPQAAILGISRAVTVARPGKQDGGFEPRRMLPLSLSYDHRIVDGADAARFMGWICECLEHPFTMSL